MKDRKKGIIKTTEQRFHNMNVIADIIEKTLSNWNMDYKEKGDALFALAKESNDDSIIYRCVSLAKEEYERARLDGDTQCLCNLAHCYFVLAHYDNSREYYQKSIELHIEGSRNKNYQAHDFYRYYKVNNVRQAKSILKYIMLSSPSKFNDPVDCPIVQGPNVEYLFPDKTVFEGLKVCCFGEDDIRKNRSNLYRLDAKNWAYYGDSHRGICIRYHFFPNQLEKRLANKYVFKKVDYREDFSFERGIVADGLLRKSKYYEEENEWRIVWYDKNFSENKYYKAKKDCLLIPINICNIIAIYVGYRCPDEIAKTVIEFAKKKKNIPLPVYKIHPDPKNLFSMTESRLN